MVAQIPECLLELVVLAAAVMVSQVQRLPEAPELPTLAVEVVGLQLEQPLPVAQAALALSSSKSTNKDLWKPKSTDFSA